MKKLITTVDTILSAFGILLSGVLTSGVIISVILRYFFSISFVQSEELLTIVFITTTFFGAALGLREKEHIAILNFVELFNERMQKALNIIVQLIIIFVSLIMIIYGIRMMQKVGGIPSAATGIKKGIYYSIMPISFTFAIFYCLTNILSLFIDIPEAKKGFQDDSELGFIQEKGEN